MWLLFFVAVAVQALAHRVAAAEDEGHCVWYDECYKDTWKKNCPYDGPAKELVDKNAVDVFKKYCSCMMPSEDSTPKTCCSPKQLVTFNKHVIFFSALLQRNSSCMSNFIKQMCEVTCSRHQSTFVKVIEVKRDGNTSYVNGIQVYFTPQYLSQTYNSCKRVTISSEGELISALDLTCGSWGSALCNANRWFESIGDASGPFAFFQTDYIATEGPINNFVPKDPTIIP